MKKTIAVLMLVCVTVLPARAWIGSPTNEVVYLGGSGTSSGTNQPQCLPCILTLLTIGTFIGAGLCEWYSGWGPGYDYRWPKGPPIVDFPDPDPNPTNYPCAVVLNSYMASTNVSAMGMTDTKGDAVITYSVTALQSADSPGGPFTTLFQFQMWKSANGMTTIAYDAAGLAVLTNYAARAKNGYITNNLPGLSIDVTKPKQFYRMAPAL